MTNQLTQEELKQLAKDAGAYMDYDIHRVYSLFFPDGALAKFAQLIQQRQGQGEVEPVAWFAFADSNGLFLLSFGDLMRSHANMPCL